MSLKSPGHGDPVKFGILGPLEVTAGAERLELGGTRQQIVLATLLVSAGQVVTMDRLVTAVYGQDLPPTARAQVQIRISALRRLFASRGEAGIISTRGPGYLIGVDDGGLDAQRFEALVAAARVARDGGHPEEAVACYRDALRLWRGAALEGTESLLLQATAARLDEYRVVANEDRLAVELDLGRHRELVGELTELVWAFPLRERLQGQLMLALYRCGRTAEALQVYRQARRTMVDELGLEPGGTLQRLEHAILRSDPALDPPAEQVAMQPVRPAVPSLLPADLADFTDRTDHIGDIRQHLIGASGQEAGPAAPVVVIVGQGGVGKTSLAVHACHGAAGHFPGGQLFADLHGEGPHPVSPTQVLERFLRALGLPGPQIPESLDERAELYRSLLADRQILVVLDDAVTESQILPLLPGRGAAAVVVTSRSRLAGLADAIHIEVDVFGADQSLDLLGRIAGVERIRVVPAAAASVAAHCGHLPLALRIAGARLVARPHWSIQQLEERLADETRRLDELRHGDLGIRTSISLTYEGAREQARRLFRRLTLLEAPVFSSWMSSALLDQPPAEAGDLLDELVGAHLVETAGPGPGSGVHSQYRFHDLIRVFARERAAAEEPAADQTAALERALGALLYLTEEARRRYYGGDYFRLRSDALRWPLPAGLVDQLVGEPLSWYERERATLVAAVRQAAQAGLVDLCWSLADSASTFVESRAWFDDWREMTDIALVATRQARHVRGEAAMLMSRGELHLEQQRFDLARRDLDAATSLFRAAGDDQGTAYTIRDLAHLNRLSGRLTEAAEGYGQALTIFRRTADQLAATGALQGLALIKLERHELEAATGLLAEALRLAQAAKGGGRIEAQVLFVMGDAALVAGQPARAVGVFEQALAIVRAIDDPVGEARVLCGLGVARTRQGELGLARGALERGLQLALACGERLAEARTRLALGELALADGDPGQAVLLAQQAGRSFRALEVPQHEAQALALLGAAQSALGDDDAAAAALAAAAVLRAELSRAGRLAGVIDQL